MSEIDADNANDCKHIFGAQCKNIYEGDTLTMDISETFGVDKFDVIVGNPPYNQGKKSIYNLFIESLIDKANYFLFVIPSIWLVGGKGMDRFRKMMFHRKDLRIIKHYENIGDDFPGVT